MFRMSHDWTWLINSSEFSASPNVRVTWWRTIVVQFCSRVISTPSWCPVDVMTPTSYQSINSHVEDLFSSEPVCPEHLSTPSDALDSTSDMIIMLSLRFRLSTPQKSSLAVHHVELACELTQYRLSYPTCTLSYYSLARDSFVQTCGHVSVSLRHLKRTGIK